ncbi:hypothetical protein P7C73_g4032, partial [Tremellales sp. Uapishka_1]
MRSPLSPSHRVLLEPPLVLPLTPPQTPEKGENRERGRRSATPKLTSTLLDFQNWLRTPPSTPPGLILGSATSSRSSGTWLITPSRSGRGAREEEREREETPTPACKARPAETVLRVGSHISSEGGVGSVLERYQQLGLDRGYVSFFMGCPRTYSQGRFEAAVLDQWDDKLSEILKTDPARGGWVLEARGGWVLKREIQGNETQFCEMSPERNTEVPPAGGHEVGLSRWLESRAFSGQDAEASSAYPETYFVERERVHAVYGEYGAVGGWVLVRFHHAATVDRLALPEDLLGPLPPALTDAIGAVHVSDCLGEFQGGVHRHTGSIGKGTIGLFAFREILRHPLFAAVPMILETAKRFGRGKLTGNHAQRQIALYEMNRTRIEISHLTRALSASEKEWQDGLETSLERERNVAMKREDKRIGYWVTKLGERERGYLDEERRGRIRVLRQTEARWRVKAEVKRKGTVTVKIMVPREVRPGLRRGVGGRAP